MTIALRLGQNVTPPQILAALNDLDRELDCGNPGKGIDDLLKENVHG